MRLLGFERVQLKPGESRQVKLTADLVIVAEAPLKARLFGR